MAAGRAQCHLIGGVVSVLIALCYAELSACFPLAGGDYTLVSRSLGPETIPLAAVLLGSSSWSDLLGSDLPVQAFLEQRAGPALATFVLLSMALATLRRWTARTAAVRARAVSSR